MMTIDQAVDKAADALDHIIARQLDDLERQMRADMAATGPEDEDALDRPPVRFSAWGRITVEDVIEMQRARCLAWRVTSLATIRQGLIAFAREG